MLRSLILLLRSLIINTNLMLTGKSCCVHHRFSFMTVPMEARRRHGIRDGIEVLKRAGPIGVGGKAK